MDSKIARSNSQWIGSVNALLREGYGVEDIARRLKCSVEAVRLEVAILREEGLLERLYWLAREQWASEHQQRNKRGRP